MPKITYIEHDGSQHTVDAEIGSTVMETALRNDIASIVAECGGSCTCATCLVHVDEKWFAVVGPPSSDEEEQLDATRPAIELVSVASGRDDQLVIHVPVRAIYGGPSHYRPFRDTWITSWAAVYWKVFEVD